MTSRREDIGNLSAEEKRRLLAELLVEKRSRGVDRFSPLQRRLWVLRQMEPTIPTHVLGVSEVRGPLDAAALQEAVRAVAGRHEILTGGFVEVEGEPVWAPSSSVWLSVPLVDVSGLASDEQDREIGRLVAREAAQVFDLATPPLVRVSLVRRAPEHHAMVVVAHQLVMDQASVGLFVREIARAYTETGQARSRGDEPATFAGFAAWQRERLATPQAAHDLDYWRHRLGGLPDMNLPTDRPRPPMGTRSLSGASHRWQVPADLAVRWEALADRTGATVPDVLLASWLTVLSRYSGRRDIAVGLPVPARPDDWAGALGPFENAIVLRADLTGDPAFAALLAQVADARTQAMDHQETPFEHLVDELPQGDSTAPPLYQVRFVHDEPALTMSHAGLEWRETWTDAPLAPFDLTLRLATAEDGSLSVRLDYATELFDASTAERMLTHLRTLSLAATERPDQVLSALPMLPPGEYARLTREWADGPAHTAEPRLVHRLIEEQAARNPEAVAVAAGSDRLTYGALNTRANRLARRLRKLGAGPEKRVGVIAERTTHTVTALLAVLKAGAAYVPLDPDTPAERQRFILADAGIDVLLAHSHHQRTWPEAVTTITLDNFGNGADGTDLDTPIDPTNLAYIIYTSGSTGTPKGVLVSCANVAHATAARQEAFGEASDVAGAAYLMLAPFTFDASAAGLYWTLGQGGRLVLPDPVEMQDPRLLGRLIEQHQVTHLDGVPSQYSVMLDVQPQALRTVRFCVLAGEALPAALVRQHYETLPEAPLYNEYGPTEATVWSTFHPCPPDFAGATVPIGRPIPGTHVHILDDDLNPLPQGIPGHIHIGGPGITRGYLNRPALTAEHFTPDPHHPGQRLYHTGDRGRWLPNGTIEFLGRTDTQTKIRGYRIELGEIETTLQNHPAIANAVVIADHGRAGDPRLIAYLITRAEAISREELNTHLLASLPHYMLPTTYVFLDKLPLTPHGKVDRQALPSPDEQQRRSAPYEAPQTKVEREVAQAFGESLGIERVGRHDDFFELGGNSLLIARVGAILAGLYGVDLPLPLLFTQPTVEGVAGTIELFWKGGYQGLQDSRDPATMLSEIQLDPDIKPDGLPMADIMNPSGVFLTGATGYLGIFILEQILEQTSADVHCLVRASSPENAIDRLKRTADTFKVNWDDKFRTRVKPVVGDLSEPRFGLSEKAFTDLAGKIDSIYHNAALVNFVWPYSVLKGPNVHGTVEVLRLACTTKVKIVHFVSTIDVLVGSHMPRPFLEDPLPQLPPHVPFSYPQTKWISEKIVELAKERGVPTTIFRPSIMMGHTETGACHQTDYILVGLRGFLELGILPEYDEVLNCTTVDYASKTFVHITMQEKSIGEIFHLWNVDAIPTMATYDWVRSYGYEFEVVPFSEAVERARRVSPGHPIYPLLPVLFLYESGEAGLPMRWDDHLKLDPRLECAHTLEAQEGTDITAPDIDEKWMHDSLSFLIERGQLKPPSAIKLLAGSAEGQRR
ncbi:non-ribosomal peptide synthetase [Nonomuraea basaltis]|uniref:non-ribosomal peptide synthetase n=1 Tax=Nonomuraea basaltis TaxID=2495887 RepID=UPI00110C4608|nr:non-ribosomal peptide synthetase [Nonomuraea basaltis]TMR88872.1 amino acid adenylation domain-containing protein [Nonomuraea basaltis]